MGEVSLPLIFEKEGILLRKILKKLWNNFDEYFAGVLLWLMVTVAFVNVVSRFTFQFSISFIEEIEIYAYVWLVFFGGAIAFKRWDHLSVSIIVNNFPDIYRKITYVFVNVIIIVFFGFMLRYSIIQVQDQIFMGIRSTSLGVPKWWYTIGMPIGSVLIIIRVIERTIKYLKEGGEK